MQCPLQSKTCMWPDAHSLQAMCACTERWRRIQQALGVRAWQGHRDSQEREGGRGEEGTGGGGGGGHGSEGPEGNLLHTCRIMPEIPHLE